MGTWMAYYVAPDKESDDQLDEQSQEEIGLEAHEDIDIISEPNTCLHQQPYQQLTLSKSR